MLIGRQIIFWIVALVGFGLFLLIFGRILLPFVAGMILAYALDPIAGWFERRGLSRAAATFVILILFILFVVVLIVVIVPILVNQLVDLIGHLPEFAERLRGLFQSLLDSRLFRFFGITTETIQGSLTGFMNRSADWLTALVFSLWSGGQAVVAVLSLIIVTPVVAFYLLYDWDRLVKRIDELLPRTHAEEIRGLAREIDHTIGAYLRGQSLACLILALYYAAGLGIAGLNFGFLIGFAAGIFSFVPFVGSTLGFAVSVIVAVVQFWPSWQPIVAVIAVYLGGQFIEGYVLQPRLIGQNVGLHPVWVLFALFAFGLLFGFLGLMIAIPAAAAIGVLARYAIRRYLASPIYRGGVDAGTE